MRAFLGGNVCENERIGFNWGGGGMAPGSAKCKYTPVKVFSEFNLKLFFSATLKMNSFGSS